MQGHFEVVEYLIKNGLSMNSKGLVSPPLSAASQGRFYDIIQLLVKNKTDINFCNEYYNMTPLYLASKYGHSKIVEYLLKKGADANVCDYVNKSPLYVASENGHVEVVNILLKCHGVACLLNTKYDTCPLQIAVLFNRTDVVHQLIRRKSTYEI